MAGEDRRARFRGGRSSARPDNSDDGGKRDWRSWAKQTRGAQDKARANAGKRNRTEPLFVIRSDYRWRPYADPGVKKRDDKIDDIEYEPLLIRLIPYNGKYFYKYMNVWLKHGNFNKMIVSNSWNGERTLDGVPLPDLLYMRMIEESERKSGNPEYFEARENWVTTAILLEHFHRLTIKRKNGKYTYDVWKRCHSFDENPNPEECPHCAAEADKSFDAEQSVRLFGRKVHWSLWTSQKQELEDAIRGVGRTCASCREGTLEEGGFSCPSCGEVLVEGEDYEELDEETLLMLRSDEIECGACGAEVRAEPILDCVKITGSGRRAKRSAGCGNPTSVDPYAVDFVLQTQRAGTATTYDITDFFDPANPGDPLPELTGPKDKEPFDFDRLFGYMTLDEQAKELGCENPFGKDADEALKEYFSGEGEEEGATEGEAEEYGD